MHSQSLSDLLYAARAMPAEEEAMTTVIGQEEDRSAINWYRELTPVEKRTFWACFGGWARSTTTCRGRRPRPCASACASTSGQGFPITERPMPRATPPP